MRSMVVVMYSCSTVPLRYKIGAVLGTEYFLQPFTHIYSRCGNVWTGARVHKSGLEGDLRCQDYRSRREVGLLGCEVYGKARSGSSSLFEYVLFSSFSSHDVGHPNIVRFIDVYEDPQFMYVIMERCSGGEVFERLIKQRRFTEGEMVDFCRQVFSAIGYIHSLEIIHRDIKAENFLYSADGSVKLIDFGLAVKLKAKGEILKDVVGSPHYIAPEMLDRKYSYPADMWSAGVLVYLMLYGRYPFDGETDELIMKRVRQGGVNWVSPDFIPSVTTMTFVQRLLNPIPTSRMSPLEAMRDAFLSQGPLGAKVSNVIVSESVVHLLNTGVVMPAKTRRRERLASEAERARSARILELEKQFEDGAHRGWRRSNGAPASAPTSPVGGLRPALMRQGTKGLIGGVQRVSMLASMGPPRTDGTPKSKRSKSLPGSHVTFDMKPPEMYVYTEGSSNMKKMGHPHGSRDMR